MHASHLAGRISRFDREASGTIRARIYTGAQTGAEGGLTGTRRVSPRAVRPTPSCRAVPG
jgi:hypothetical protein